MTSTFTISHTIDQEIVDQLETEFDGYRSRIARMSAHAGDTLVEMFGPLGPAQPDVIDIEAIEFETVELELVPQPKPHVLVQPYTPNTVNEGVVLELAVA